jgi:hypothetical protein
MQNERMEWEGNDGKAAGGKQKGKVMGKLLVAYFARGMGNDAPTFTCPLLAASSVYVHTYVHVLSLARYFFLNRRVRDMI